MNRRAKKALIQKLVRREAEAAVRVSDAIAAVPEPGFEEFRSAQLLTDYLESRGFRVERPWKHMPTAFKAVRGKGKPVIGLLAEYDALPDCGPKSGEWGHGCGHNLLGTAAAVGGIVAAEALEATDTAGSVVVWGCPAEEICAGAPVAVRQAKKAVDLGMNVDLNTGMEIENEAYNVNLATEDRQEGIRAFNEKRKPRWQGR